MKAFVVVAVLAAAIFAGTAQAGARQAERNVAGTTPAAGVFSKPLKAQFHGKHTDALYSSAFLDGVGRGISGYALTTTLEDDMYEWLSLFGPIWGVNENVLAFVCIYAVDPNDPCYLRMFIGPSPTQTFIKWFGGQSVTIGEVAVAVMTITHEANHYKLFSGDEGRVNACALQQFPGVLSTYFQIYPTITKTVPVKKTVWRWKWVWAHRHGKRVKVRRHVRRVVTRYEQRTFQNPDYVNLVAAALAFYRSQPPPYSTGTCY